jgi:hypothetical protein
MMRRLWNRSGFHLETHYFVCNDPIRSNGWFAAGLNYTLRVLTFTEYCETFFLYFTGGPAWSPGSAVLIGTGRSD